MIKTKLCGYGGRTYESASVAHPQMRVEDDHNLQVQKTAGQLTGHEMNRPRPHSPTATTLPLPSRLNSISLSRAERYASGPPLYLSNSAERVGWQPTVAYNPLEV